jgi:hypothetical protein
MGKDWSWLLVPVAVATGWAIAVVDAQPGWDDTGITAGAVFGSSLVFGVLRTERAWIWALAVGSWIPLLGIVRHQNYGALLALLFAFAGAYTGAFGRKWLSRATGSA